MDLTVMREPRLKTSVGLPRDIHRDARDVASRHGLSLSEYLVRLIRADLLERGKGRRA